MVSTPIGKESTLLTLVFRLYISKKVRKIRLVMSMALLKVLL
jgi:hypothetical protein